MSSLRCIGFLVIGIWIGIGLVRPVAGVPHAEDKCTTIIVGKDATADGSVIVGHNEDWGEYVMPLRWNPTEKHAPGAIVHLHSGQTLPQVETTLAFLWPAADCNGINECQVAITDNTGSCRKELYQEQRGIEMQELVRLTLQRSRTARDAVRTMGEFIDRVGYKCVDGPNGDIFSVADPQEAWWMEVTTDGHWVAQRVPDDSFVVIANRYRIGTVDFRDASKFLGSSNLVAFAQEKGWFDAAQAAFHFAAAYSKPEASKSFYSARREWRVKCLLSGNSLDADDNSLALVPAKKLTPRDIMAVLRDHYEGTKYDLSEKHTKSSPHQTPERTICVMATDASTVAHLRSWLPDPIGGVFWFSAGTPCSSIYVPYYLAVSEFSKPFSTTSESLDSKNGFWTFNALENLVNQFYADKGRGKTEVSSAIDAVRDSWRRFEDDEFAVQGAVEKTAVELYEKDRRAAQSFLSHYCNGLALEAYTAAQELTTTLQTKHYR